MEITEDQKWAQHRQTIHEFVTDQQFRGELTNAINQDKLRVSVDLNLLRERSEELVKDIIHNPETALRYFTPELNNDVKEYYDENMDQDSKKGGIQQLPTYHIGFTGDLAFNLVTPRGLTSKLSNQLVGVQGIVTRLGSIQSKISKSVHYCETTEKGHIKSYDNQYDLAAVHKLKNSKAIPTKDADGNSMVMELGYSKFINTQTFILQELPETAPPGLLPRSIEVVLENDLVDTVKPGDRIQINGVFKSIANLRTQHTGIFKTILVATNTQILNTEIGSIEVNANDIKNIKEQAKKTDMLTTMINSIAPSIQGHDLIKQGILLQLLGGVEKNIEQKFHLRGDINILMIGDPSTAKSQMLRYVMNMAPLAINTTGRGSSGVGLTACVKIDRDTGARTLEAGAMVLADRGIVCIDELDKMDETDRVAIHEAMEQQTVTIAKAGINCSLNARCSVIAAANPIYGEYHTDLPPTKNIQLPDSLLSRFDLLFIVLDEKNQEKDRLVAERVTKNHMYRAPGNRNNINVRENLDLEDMDHVIQPQVNQNEGMGANDVFLKNSCYTTGTKKAKKMFSPYFLQKYIKYAKKVIEPKLNESSVSYLSKKWSSLRQKDLANSEVKVLPISIRTYESMIRLSTAFAKLHLSKEVTKEHCKLAYLLLKKSLFGSDDDDEDSDDDDNEDGMEEEYVPKKKAPKKPVTAKKPKQQSQAQQQQTQKSEGFKPYNKQTQQSQASKQQSQAKTKQSEEAKINNQMKAINLDDQDEDDADKKINELKIGSIKVTKKEQSEVFKVIGNIFSNGKDDASVNEIWEKIKPIFGADNKNKLIKCLIELDDAMKIDYNADEETIYLI